MHRFYRWLYIRRLHFLQYKFKFYMFLLDKMILSSEKKKNDIKEWRYRIDIFENIRETAHTLHYLYDLELNDITMDLLRQ